jgi:hypothetical protein
MFWVGGLILQEYFNELPHTCWQSQTFSKKKLKFINIMDEVIDIWGYPQSSNPLESY